MSSASNSVRPRRKRGIAWITIFLIVFAVTSYLIRDWGSNPLNSTPSGRDATAQTDDSRDVSFLVQVDDERWRSPVGLVYGPGSQEGHRLKHLARHLQDDPGREVHGVFDGDLNQVLQWIDRGYRLSRQEGSTATTKRQGQRTVIDVDLEDPIGFVGGKDGKQAGHPTTKRMRLILEDKDVITAYPVWPKR